MDEMPSAEFRKRYAKLTEPTVVTANGHLIGTWVPGEARLFVPGPTNPYFEPVPEGSVVLLGATAQERRDALLGKINRSKK